MNNLFLKSFILSILLSAICCNSPGGNENTSILMKTTLGDIKLILYDSTPLHRDNFIKLVNSGFYDGISFHRVINSFMIQAGDPSTRTANLPSGADSLNTYTIPAEFRSEYFHKKGALAAARQGNEINPGMRSSGTQFYLVQGKKLTDYELDQIEKQVSNNIKQAMFIKFLHQVSDSARLKNIQLTEGEIQEKASSLLFDYLTTNKDFKIPEAHRSVYKALGGVPRLDATYTVFGEVTEGLDVIDRIAAVNTDAGDRPLTDIKILKMKIVK